ncbi:MAG: methyl-accepting chemotaxis protein [Rhodocyclaceae bacterium]
MRSANVSYDNTLNLLGRICVGMFHFVDNVRMFRVGNSITIFTIILLFAGTGATMFTFKSVSDIVGVWRDFDSGLARRIDLLGHFEHYLGYSGLAHHWPAAQAGDIKAKQAAGEALVKVREGFPAFLNANPTEQEKTYLAQLEKTVTAHERNLAGTAEAIDAVATAAALSGIKQSLAEHRKAGADAVEDAIWALSAKVGGIMFAAGVILAVFGLFTFWFIRFRVALPLEAINSTMAGLSRGDTSVNIPFTAKSDEVGEMARSVQVFKDNAVVKERMEEQKQQVNQTVRATAFELGDLTKNVRNATADQASASQSMSAATEQLTVSIDQVAQNADHALTVTRETVIAVKDGEKAVQETIAVMEETAKLVAHAAERVDELGKQSVQIQEIVTIIQGIAKQTDLLALNASIESARAGEAGRGFSVVADEVRHLSEKTNTSAHDISDILTRIRGQMEQVSSDVAVASSKAKESAARSRLVGEALALIDNRSGMVAGAMEEIANAAREQSTAGHEIAQQVETVAGSSETVSAQINRIDELTHGLNQTVTSI